MSSGDIRMTKIKNKVVPLAVMAVAATGGAGCSVIDKSYNIAAQDADSISDAITRNSKMKEVSSVEVTDSLWLGGEAYRVSEDYRAPAIFQRKVSFKQLDPINLSELVTLISVDTGIKMILTQDAFEYVREATSEQTESNSNIAMGMGMGMGMVEAKEKSIPGSDIEFVLNYSGTLSGLLDVITGKLGLFWRYERGEVVIKRSETKTYTVDLPSGKVTFQSDTMSDIGGSETGSSSHATKMEFTPEDSWENLSESVKSMLSQSGKHVYSDVQGLLTVTDTPQVHSRIEEYIKTINSIASKQVAVEAHVFEITSDDTGEFDANIMALYDWKGDLNLGLNGSMWTVGKGVGRDPSNNRFDSSAEATLNMLRTNRNSSLVTSGTIYAMNGHPTPFQQINEVSYVAERSVTIVEGGTTEASITPGKTSEGISMMIMPRVMSDGRVMMNFSIDTSSILAMNKEGEEGQEVTMPERASNRYQQVVTVRSGEPLMIAGLERTNHDATYKSPLGRYSWIAGGSKSGGKTRVMTMIVLTPYIMSK